MEVHARPRWERPAAEAMEKPGLRGAVGSEPSVHQAAVAMAQLEHPVAAGSVP